MAFPGPSLPSTAEAQIAHKLGCSLIGTASLYHASSSSQSYIPLTFNDRGLVYAARSNGLSVLCLAQPVNLSKGLSDKPAFSKAVEAVLSILPVGSAQEQRESPDLPQSLYRDQQV